MSTVKRITANRANPQKSTSLVRRPQGQAHIPFNAPKACGRRKSGGPKPCQPRNPNTPKPLPRSQLRSAISRSKPLAPPNRQSRRFPASPRPRNPRNPAICLRSRTQSYSKPHRTLSTVGRAHGLAMACQAAQPGTFQTYFQILGFVPPNSQSPPIIAPPPAKFLPPANKLPPIPFSHADNKPLPHGSRNAST